MTADHELDYLAHLRADSGRFRQVLTDVDPASPVPTCPGWSADDLLWHLGEVQWFWGTIVRDRLTDPDEAEAAKPDRPSDHAGLLAFFDAASATLTDALAATPDETPVWTWFAADQSVGFIRRRQAHEALIHRLDAELTAGSGTDLDPALATDGVLEVLECIQGAPGWAALDHTGPIGRLETTDTGAQWLVQVDTWSATSPNTGTTYTDETSLNVVASGEATFTVSGTARDLDAWLWNRPTLTAIACEGDCARLEELIRTGVQ